MNQLHCLTLILILITQSLATIPGLRLPVWYTADFVSIGHPQMDQKTRIELRFTPIGLNLQDVSVTLKLPDGITATAIHSNASIAELKNSTSFQWDIVSHKEVFPSSIQAIITFKTPYLGLKSRIDEVWQHEALWQRNQLKARVDDLLETYDLSFFLPIFVTQFEGDFKLPSTPIHKPYPIHKDKAIYLIAPPAISSPSQILVTSFEASLNQHKTLHSNQDTLKAVEATDPGYVLKVSDEYQKLTYSLAYAFFMENKAQKALDTLRQNQNILLAAGGLSYEYILQSRNLEALILYSDNQAALAEETLKSTVRTMTEAQSRPYLLYNLSVLNLLNEQAHLAKINLNEALRIHPGLHIAKKLLLEL